MKLLRNVAATFILAGVVFGSGCTYALKILAKDQLNQGIIAFNEGNRGNAKTFFRDAIDYDPNNAVAWLYLGAAQVRDYREQYKNEGRKKELANEALQTFETALDLAGKNCVNRDNAISNIVVIYDDLNDDESWRTWILKRAEDECSTKVAKLASYYSIAIKYYNCSQEQTTRYADKAKLLANDSWHYRDMDYPAAMPDKRKAEECVSKGLEYIEKALQEDPEDANSLFYKGMLYGQRQILTRDPVKRKEMEKMRLKIGDLAVEAQKRKEAEGKQEK